MTFTPDPQVAAVLAALTGDQPVAPGPLVGDWRSIREAVAGAYPLLGARLPAHPEVSRTTFTTTAPHGTTVALHWFCVDDRRPGSAVVHAHGGGMVAGSVDLFAPFITQYVAASGVPFLSVDYRLAPEARGTVAAQDVHAGLVWLVEHAGELGVDPERIALLGESAGAGIAAGASILAREQGPRPARQILIYPMLDDRTAAPDPNLEPVVTWPHTNNRTGWGALLGDDVGTDAVPEVAAPARLSDFTGLPPAYIEVGELDIFRDEDLAYAAGLWRAGISVELHVHPGLVHGFDHYAPDADATRRAVADRLRVIRSL